MSQGRCSLEGRLPVCGVKGIPMAKPKSVKVWMERGWPQAEASFHGALELNPSYARAHRLLGVPAFSHLASSESFS